ncbi:hypothetical protein PRIPAC_93978 [Pristionchus pacificus]|nr:hypothetical protein PRIPAC_93978 [Pristionchus pacificus]
MQSTQWLRMPKFEPCQSTISILELEHERNTTVSCSGLVLSAIVVSVVNNCSVKDDGSEAVCSVCFTLPGFEGVDLDIDLNMTGRGIEKEWMAMGMVRAEGNGTVTFIHHPVTRDPSVRLDWIMETIVSITTACVIVTQFFFTNQMYYAIAGMAIVQGSFTILSFATDGPHFMSDKTRRLAGNTAILMMFHAFVHEILALRGIKLLDVFQPTGASSPPVETAGKKRALPRAILPPKLPIAQVKNTANQSKSVERSTEKGRKGKKGKKGK